MNTSRRKFVAGLGASLAFSPSAVFAQTRWPDRPIKIVVGFAVGGQTDLFARLYGDHISRQTGANVVVENKTGALGSIAAAEVKRAAADGHTLLFNTSGAMSVNRVLIKDLAYDTDRDFTIVSAMPTGGIPLLVSSRLGVKTLDEFIRHAKTAERVSIGTFGVGSPAHLTIAELNRQFGLKIEPVHYRGEAPMLTDVASQVLDGGVGTYASALPIIQAGACVPVAVPRKRLTTLPHVATFGEQGATSPLFDLTTYQCCAVPKATPKPIVDRLSSLLVEAGRSPRALELFQKYGIDEGAFDQERTREIYERESKIWIDLAAKAV